MEKNPASPDYRDVLLDELHKRQNRRPKYSLRAFARDIGVKAATLSDVLKGRYGLSPDKALKIAERLGFTDDHKAYFRDLVAAKHARSSAAREAASRRVHALRPRLQYQILQESQLLAHSSWEFPAVRQFIRLKDGDVTLQELSRRLRIPRQKVADVVDGLVTLGLLERDGSRFKMKDANLRSDSPVPSAAIRSLHKSILHLAGERIETEPIPERKYLSSVFTVKASRIEEAREWLEEMNREFLEKFHDDKNPTDLYAFALQLFKVAGGHADAGSADVK
jgi:uncharacterized protein (TIGR02147 family)